MRLEARYVREDNQVTGLVQTPCVNGEPFFSGSSEFADQTGCSNAPGTAPKNETANGGQATGPSATLICGQTGRCDRLGYAPLSVANGGSAYLCG